MDDDFNILGVLVVLFEIVCEVNKFKIEDVEIVNGLVVCLKELVGVFGLLE